MIKNVLEKGDTLRARVFSHYDNTASCSSRLHLALGVVVHDEKKLDTRVNKKELERLWEINEQCQRVAR